MLKAIAAAALSAGLVGCAAGYSPPRAPIQESAAADVGALQAPSCGARIYVLGALTSGAFGLNVASDVYIDGVLVDAVSHNPEISVIDVPPGRVEVYWLPAGSDPNKFNAISQVLNLSPMQATFIELEARTFVSPIGILGAVIDPQRPMTFIKETTSRQDFVGKPIVFHRRAPGCP